MRTRIAPKLTLLRSKTCPMVTDLRFLEYHNDFVTFKYYTVRLFVRSLTFKANCVNAFVLVSRELLPYNLYGEGRFKHLQTFEHKLQVTLA